MTAQNADYAVIAAIYADRDRILELLGGEQVECETYGRCWWFPSATVVLTDETAPAHIDGYGAAS